MKILVQSELLALQVERLAALGLTPCEIPFHEFPRRISAPLGC